MSDLYIPEHYLPAAGNASPAAPRIPALASDTPPAAQASQPHTALPLTNAEGNSRATLSTAPHPDAASIAEEKVLKRIAQNIKKDEPHTLAQNIKQLEKLYELNARRALPLNKESTEAYIRSLTEIRPAARAEAARRTTETLQRLADETPYEPLLETLRKYARVTVNAAGRSL